MFIKITGECDIAVRTSNPNALSIRFSDGRVLLPAEWARFQRFHFHHSIFLSLHSGHHTAHIRPAAITHANAQMNGVDILAVIGIVHLAQYISPTQIIHTGVAPRCQKTGFVGLVGGEPLGLLDFGLHQIELFHINHFILSLFTVREPTVNSISSLLVNVNSK